MVAGPEVGCLFFWEKQLASLRHFFPPEKTPHPVTDLTFEYR
jgi:hypothetical protein